MRTQRSPHLPRKAAYNHDKYLDFLPRSLTYLFSLNPTKRFILIVYPPPSLLWASWKALWRARGGTGGLLLDLPRGLACFINQGNWGVYFGWSALA